MRAIQLALLCQEGLDPTRKSAMLERWEQGGDWQELLPVRAERHRAGLEALLGGNPTVMARWEGLLKQVDAGGLGLMRPGDPHYPPALAAMIRPPDPLFYQGNPALAHGECVGIVGTRQPDEMGLGLARIFATALREMACTVVSGGAAGIDGAAHRAAGAAGTIAVLGAGFSQPFPWHHRQLFEEIARDGLLLSEWPPWTRPEHYRFPRRNRVIAGLCRAVVVVQAPARSGALNTAHHACEEGREVLVCPGPAGHRLYAGSHQLIREGARLMGSVEDLRLDLGLLPLAFDQVPPGAAAREAQPLHTVEASVVATPAVPDPELWQALDKERGLDELMQILPAQGLAARLLSGELEGWLRSVPGERWMRC